MPNLILTIPSLSQFEFQYHPITRNYRKWSLQPILPLINKCYAE